MNAPAKITIIPRVNLDFHLDDSIEKYWYENNPFKTRFMEAVFAGFPPGERYFMTSVRHFKDQVLDAELRNDIQAFNRQEAQHGIVHTQFNELLKNRGVPIDQIDDFQNRRLARATKQFSPKFNIALTAATEHLTSLMADTFCGDPKILARMDYRIRALLVWHAMEEMEHKSVAFDVMQEIAKVGYSMRVAAMLVMIVAFTSSRIHDTNMLLKHDGFSRRERVLLMSKGLWWAFGGKGVISFHSRSFLCYLKPNFHPQHLPVFDQYHKWLKTYTATGDPIAASETLF